MTRPRKKVATLIETRSKTHIVVGAYATIAGIVSAASIFVGTFSTDLNNLYHATIFGVEVTESFYLAPNGDTVHYRLCQSEELDRSRDYPAILFSPGYDINWDRWTYWCIRSAQNDYVVMMKDRPGERPIENQGEIEAGLAHLRSFPIVDPERVMLGGSSYGNREIQNYVTAVPDDIEGYFNISGYNEVQKMSVPGSFTPHEAKVLVLSGGGEQPPNQRDCDADGRTWTDAFVSKLNEDGRGNRVVAEKHFDQPTYGCVHHGFMWDYDSKATKEAAWMIAGFVEYIVGRGPTPL